MKNTGDEMTEIHEMNGVNPLVEGPPVHALLKAMAERKKVSQEQIARELTDRGIQTSTSTVNRILNGTRPVSEQELEAICQILDEGSEFERIRTICSNGKGGADVRKQPAQRATIRDLLRRHPVASRAGIWLLICGAAIVVALLLHGSTGTVPSTGVGTNKPGGAQSTLCDQYEVAARDLWLRDKYGATQIELPHGQRVTVTNRASTYWEVATDNGQIGWVDHNYLKPLC